jgi:hypothetical protein
MFSYLGFLPTFQCVTDHQTQVDTKVLDAKTDGRQRGKQSLTTILAAGTEDDHSLGRSHISAGANSDTTETVMASL